MLNKFTMVEWGECRFLITDSPKYSEELDYAKRLKKLHVRKLVRTCELTYSEQVIRDAGIEIYEMYFNDGATPPRSMIQQWFSIVNENMKSEEQSFVAVHCMAGLGRAPLLVALALIEAGADYLTAVSLIREKRRGAINGHQIEYLRSYRRMNAFKHSACCSLL
mmetsp:Transcript_11189/g.22026  ORF Transcript_11189/g.22026 Transcript_11189/m.22026 type:complete len:164 (+) Transcript_11189:40-531(+)